MRRNLVAGVKDPNVIDVVGQDAAGTCLLIMVEERQWGSDPEQPRQLREKINAYVGYVLDGTIIKQYPETSGRGISIQLNCPQRPVGEIATITSHAAAQLEKMGIGFVVKIMH